MRFSIAVNMERTSDAQPMPEVVANALEFVQMAEAGGFEIAWSAEHLGIELTIGPNPLLILAHWAARTSRIRLGTGVIVAPYWHPLRAAGEAALLDLYCDGRLELGFGRGAFQYEFDRVGGGMAQTEGGKYLRELIPAMKRLWEGDYTHDGELWQFPKSTSVPRPLQRPHPPLWIAARDPATFDFAVKEGCHLLTTPLGKPFAEVEVLGEKRRAAMAANPGRPRPRWLVLRTVAVFESESDAEQIARTTLERGDRFGSLFATDGDVRQGFPQPLQREEPASGAPIDVRQGMVFGTPAQVVEQLRAYEAVGVDSFCYSGNFGLPHDVARRSLELFIHEVMPQFGEGN
jgi:alkanesulfonate monooxygenase SsuD/methylene tetrahydromethanopterin reductase-like flavin-dependent oxidoreductase (luciferase family)